MKLLKAVILSLLSGALIVCFVIQASVEEGFSVNFFSVNSDTKTDNISVMQASAAVSNRGTLSDSAVDQGISEVTHTIISAALKEDVPPRTIFGTVKVPLLKGTEGVKEVESEERKEAIKGIENGGKDRLASLPPKDQSFFLNDLDSLLVSLGEVASSIVPADTLFRH